MVYLTRKGIPAHPFGGLVDALFCVWNFGISLFSAWGTWNLGGAIFNGLQREGLYYTICTDTTSILRLGEGRPAMLARVSQGRFASPGVSSCLAVQAILRQSCAVFSCFPQWGLPAGHAVVQMGIPCTDGFLLCSRPQLPIDGVLSEECLRK